MKKKPIVFLVVLVMLLSMTSACSTGEAAGNPSATDSSMNDAQTTTSTPAETVTEEPIRVALVVNQKFGDGGPVDQMMAGLNNASTEFGVEVKSLESVDPAGYEADIRAMANAGYDLIITTFPPMSEATKSIAEEYPDTKFGAIYQFINSSDSSIPNIYDTQFQGQDAMYILGAMASQLTTTGKIGIIIGAEQPSPNADGNAFMRGVKEYGSGNNTVLLSYVGSYEDVAKAKEIAVAMIADGCDVLQTDAGKCQVGVMEAAKDAGILVCGDTSDYSSSYPEGVYGYFGGDFTNCVYLMIKDFVEGNFKGGTTGIMNYSNGSFYLTPDMFTNFKTLNPKHADAMDKALVIYNDLDAKILSGEADDRLCR